MVGGAVVSVVGGAVVSMVGGAVVSVVGGAVVSVVGDVVGAVVGAGIVPVVEAVVTGAGFFKVSGEHPRRSHPPKSSSKRNTRIKNAVRNTFFLLPGDPSPISQEKILTGSLRPVPSSSAKTISP